MKHQSFLGFLLGLVMVAPAAALVNPQEADIIEQDWMANILVKGSQDQFYSLFCKGSLIHEYWVMSSPGCLYDPFGTIDNVVGSDKAEYAVALGNLGGLFKVERRLISPDGNIMLLQLNRPSRNKILPLLYRAPEQLRGVKVRIFGSESSAAFADNFFNPQGSLGVSCRVGGQEFFHNGKMCYVTSAPKFLFRQLMAAGRVVDPLAPDAPKSPLNSTVTPNPKGDRLYVDFAEYNSYPCYEDMGSPIVATLNGELVQVGLVVATGMATGVPMCNGSFVNLLVSLKTQMDFISTSIAQGQFDQQCPAQANLRYEKLTPTRVRFYWDAIHQAAGYKVLYTTALGYVPIQSVDVGNLTKAIVDLNPGATYSVAMQGYNMNCTGTMSRPVTVRL